MPFLLLSLLACGNPQTADQAPASDGREAVAKEVGSPDPVDSADSADTAAIEETPFVFSGDVPTNVLIISVDTTRRDQIGYFSDLESTPTWDAILAESVVLMDHRSCSSWTGPSMVCATTGLLPIEEGWWPSGVTSHGSMAEGEPPVDDLPDLVPSLARIFAKAGYLTSLVTSNGVFSRANGSITKGYIREEAPVWASADVVAQRARSMLRVGAATGKPWLQHVHFVDPHTPYNASESYVEAELGALESTLPWDFSNPTSIDAALAAYDGATEETQAAIRDHLLAAYRAQITYFDDVLADFWSDLDSMGMLDDTLVVFWTDHGEQHGEHGEFHHGKSLHSQENRAMASFWARNLEPVEWTERTYHQDIASTLYDIMALTPGYTPTGHVVGTAPADRLGVTYNFVDNVLPEFSLIRGDSQLYYHHSGEKYFYDLAEDPDGERDIYDISDPRVVALEAEVTPWMTAHFEETEVPALVFEEERPRNLLFIGIDTLRRDRIGRWSSTEPSITPFLDGLLEESVVLEDHRSCANWTLSSLFCLFTGNSTVTLGFEPVSGDSEAPAMPESVDVAPRRLSDAGYQTVAVSGSPYIVPDWLVTDGFQEVNYLDRGGNSWASAEWIVDQARTSLDELNGSEDPWYLHLHFMDPHTPYDAPFSYRRAAGIPELPELGWNVASPKSFNLLKSLYDTLSEEVQATAYTHVDAHYESELRYLDDQLSKLWMYLRASEALEDTLVVFWTDHGEQFWEHGEIHHDRSLYAEENRSMAAFWSPSLSPGTWNGPTVHQDIFPTIMEALEIPIDAELDGDVVGTRPSNEPRLAFRYSAPDLPRMTADYKGLRLHYSWDGSRALYDTRTDPDEIYDIYDPEDPALPVLWHALDTEIDRVLTYLPHLEPQDREP